MNSMFGAALSTIIAITSLDANAKPAAPCILMLEAAPAPVEPTRIGPAPSRPACPLVIAYSLRERPHSATYIAPRVTPRAASRATPSPQRALLHV